MLRGCGKWRGSKSCKVWFSTSLQPDKNMYACVYFVCVFFLFVNSVFLWTVLSEINK